MDDKQLYLDEAGLSLFYNNLKDKDLSKKVDKDVKINGKDLSTDISLTPEDVGAIAKTDAGSANGIATLDENGKIPAEQLPKISDEAADIIYDNSESTFEATDVQTALNEISNILDDVVYIDFADGEEHEGLIKVDADTLNGHDANYFATKESVTELQNTVNSDVQNLTSHVNDKIVHITEAERTKWNSQDGAKSYADNAVSTAKSELTGTAKTYTDLGKVETQLEALATKDSNLQTAVDGKVPQTRTVNNKPLSADITLTYADVEADKAGSADAALTSAKSYTDTEVADTLKDAKDYADTASANALKDAKDYNDTAYANANKYTDTAISNLINGAPETLNTLKEIADAMAENDEVITALDSAIGTKANQAELDTHTGNDTIHITSEERTNWNDANDKKHTHENKSILDATTASYTTEEQTKLSGIEANANAYVHPEYTEQASGLYKVTVDNKGHVSAVSAVEKADITALGIPGQDTTYSNLSQFTNDSGYITGIDKAMVTDALGYTPAETDTTYEAAGSDLGLVKTGGNVTIENGIVTVNDNGHNHTIDNITNLQVILGGKVPTTRAVNGKLLSADVTLSAADVNAIPTTEKGVANGVATLDENGKINVEQIPDELSGNAVDITYDNSASGLTATDIQAAIDELANEPSVPEGVTYVDGVGTEDAELALVDADTLGGQLPEYYATAQDLEDLRAEVEAGGGGAEVPDGVIYMNLESAGESIDKIYNDADSLGGESAEEWQKKIDDVVDGTTVVGEATKATFDGDENKISETYLNKSIGGTINGEVTFTSPYNAGQITPMIVANNVGKFRYSYINNNGGLNFADLNMSTAAPTYERQIDGVWNEYAILHSGNYSDYALPKTGGEIDGNITSHADLFQTTTEEKSLTHRVINSNRDLEHILFADGTYRLVDNSTGGAIYNSSKDGSNVWYGTATGNLPLSGGNVTADITIGQKDSAPYLRLEDIGAVSVRLPNGTYGGWDRGFKAVKEDGTDLGGFGILGNGQEVTNYYIGSEYWNPILSVIPSTREAKVNGNTILHSGNVGDYALTKSGGTLNETACINFKAPTWTNASGNYYVNNDGSVFGGIGMFASGGAGQFFYIAAGTDQPYDSVNGLAITKDNILWKNNSIIHTGNKPTGSYTGNGSHEVRSISTGGIGSALLVWGRPSTGETCIALVTQQGALGKKSLAPFALSDGTCNFFNGVLALGTDDVSLNESGTIYYYQVL